jgi:raffinose/stachyose/melibiose transport system permease protein
VAGRSALSALNRTFAMLPRSGLRIARRRQRRVSFLWVVPALALVLAVHYIAIGAGAWYAFTDWNGLTHARYIGLGNFRQIFRDPAARGALEHTLVLALAFVAASNAIGLALAVGLNRTLKSRNFIRALFFAPVVMSPLAVAYIWQFIFAYDGPLNSLLGAVGLGSWRQAWLGSPTWALWAIFLVLVWQFSGLTMIIYLAGLQGVPDELQEAAAVDGATTFYRFRRVTLPLLAPALTIALTLTLINGLRVFDQIIALTNGGPYYATETLTTQIYQQTFVNGRFGYGAATALVLTAIITIFALAQLGVLRAREKRL